MKKCEICFKEFEENCWNQKICSTECKAEYSRRHSYKYYKKNFKKRILEGNCVICGKSYEYQGRGRPITCSKECSDKRVSLRNKSYHSLERYKKYRREWSKEKTANSPKEIRVNNCIICGSEFNLKHKANNKTCSENCRKEQQRIRINNWNKRPEVRQRQKECKTIQKKLYSRLRHTLSVRIKLPKRDRRTHKYIKYTTEELRKHLEINFKEGMSWKNYGRIGWHIDHIKPLSKFKFFHHNGEINKEEVIKSMSLDNLQPLWFRENIIKSNH